MKETELKPSQRINQIIGPTRSDSEWQERAVEAIIHYLDESRTIPSDEPCVHQWRASHDYTLLYCVKCGKEHKSVEQDDKHLCADKPFPTTSEVDKTEEINTLSNIIRIFDGNNDKGAGAIAEHLIDLGYRKGGSNG